MFLPYTFILALFPTSDLYHSLFLNIFFYLTVYFFRYLQSDFFCIEKLIVVVIAAVVWYVDLSSQLPSESPFALPIDPGPLGGA